MIPNYIICFRIKDAIWELLYFSSKTLAGIDSGDWFRRLSEIQSATGAFHFIFPLQNGIGSVINATSVFYLRGEGAEAQVIELHQMIELGSAMEGCKGKQGSKYHVHTTACCATRNLFLALAASW